MEKKLPKLLKKYNNYDFITQERSKYIYYLCITGLISVFLLIVFRLTTHPITHIDDSTHLTILTPLLILFILLFGSLWLLIKGNFILTSHLVPTFVMLIIWIIMFLENKIMLTRINTVINVFIALSMMPLLIGKHRFSIVLYSGFNIIMVFIFMAFFKEENVVIQSNIWDYIIGVSVAFTFVGFIGYGIYSVNKKALENAERDFTKRIKIERDFAQSKKKYKELTELLPITVYEADIEGRVIYTNMTGFRSFGYTEEDLKQGVNISSLIVEKEFINANIFKIKQGNRCGNQYTAVKKNGEKFPVQVFSNVIKEDGKFIGLSGVIIDISDRLKAEEELKESENRFRSIMEQSSFSMQIFAPDGSLLYINEAGRKLWGINSDSSNSFNYNMLNDLQLKALGLMQLVKQAFIGERVRLPAVEYDLAKSIGQGLFKTVQSDFYPVRKTDGSLRSIIVIHQDISERVKAERALRASEQKFRETTFLLPQTVYESDLNGKLTFINKAGTTMFGYTEQEVSQGLNVIDTIEVNDRSRVRESIQNILNGKQTHGNQYLGLRKDGSTFPMEIFSAPIIENEKPVGFRGVIYDLTQIKKVENDLRQSNELFKTLFESTPLSMTLSDMDGKFIMVNKAFCNDLGLNPDDAIGKTINDFGITTEDGKEFIINELLQDKGFVENFEISTTDKNGRRHELYISAIIVTINDQKVVLRSNINITERKKLEEQLKNYNLKLEELVKERTEELEASNEELSLTNEELFEKSEIIAQKNNELNEAIELIKTTQQKLIQTEKMASLGVLTAGVAHEVNNPLNYLMGAYIGLETYFDEHGSKEISKTNILLDSMKVGIERISSIVKGLNQFSQLNENMDEACDIHAIIDNCLTILHNKLKYKVDLTKRYLKDPIIVIGNVSQLHQVFINIIVNAIQAILVKGNIIISTKIIGSEATVEIIDDGIGIEMNYLSKITDPFFTTKPPGEGTGLGLSITQNIMKELHGEMKFESEVNKGTKVILTFPLK
ncbi:MAG: PAS domain S-box protein [Bacteroidales bacterium]|nr:PAS domain S-box protein [Bacteroidales bacterium]